MRYADTGDVPAHTQPVRPDKRKLNNLHELYIIRLTHENPAFYLQICAKIFEATGVSVSGSTVCKVLHRNGLMRKKLVNPSLDASPFTERKDLVDFASRTCSALSVNVGQ